jgi:hypothetical protein
LFGKQKLKTLLRGQKEKQKKQKQKRSKRTFGKNLKMKLLLKNTF